MIVQLFDRFGAACGGGDFLGLPKWYAYLNSQQVTNSQNGTTSCAPQITNISDVWLILAAVLELLLRLAALFAIGYVIYGSFMFITSQGDPSKTQVARQTVINALVGLVIAVAAATIVAFIAGGFS